MEKRSPLAKPLVDGAFPTGEEKTTAENMQIKSDEEFLRKLPFRKH